MDVSDDILVSWDGLKWFRNPRGIIPREKNLLKIIQSLSDQSKVFVDVGAHVGFYAIRMAKQCRWVHAIEPNPESIEILRKNIELNDITNITIHPYACGAIRMKSKIYISDTTTTLFQRDDRPSIEVEVATLDELIHHCDVVKIDVEGWEEQVLLGAKRLIVEEKPIWLIEHHDVGEGAKHYPETRGMSQRIRNMLSEYRKITFDLGRSVYIHESVIDEVPREALRLILKLAVYFKVTQNLESLRPWYYGLPYTWWHGMSLVDFMEEVPERVVDEPEWLSAVSE